MLIALYKTLQTAFEDSELRGIGISHLFSAKEPRVIWNER